VLELENAARARDAVEDDRLRSDVGRERMHLRAQPRVHLQLEERRPFFPLRFQFLDLVFQAAQVGVELLILFRFSGSCRSCSLSD
jgi:hypothetical protein